MRIIAGAVKGMRLGPVPPGVRPVSDRAREGLFSSFGQAVPGARVLDLYAGTGALGIEALSRGAEGATFVDRSPGALRAIRANLARTGLGDRAGVVGSDVLRFLRGRTGRGGAADPWHLWHPCHLCFLDPPYGVALAELQAVLTALPGRLVPSGWTLALTRGVRSSMPVIPVNWQVARRLEYGDTLIVICREV